MSLRQPLSTLDANARYVYESEVGKGTFGTVYRARDQLDNDRVVAAKDIVLDKDELGFPSTAMREVALLRELQHPNIVRLLEVLHSEHRLTLVFEFGEKDLKNYMDSHFKILLREPFLTKFIVWQILQGVDHLHSHRVLHRDLKPQNILIDPKQTLVKLADFGLARVYGVPVRAYTHEVVTLWYRAPEILLGSKVYSTPVDVWSVACIMAELAMGGQPLFTGENEIGQLFKIFQVLGTPDEASWPGISKLADFCPMFPKWRPKPLAEAVTGLDDDGLDLLQAMLRWPPEQRITAREALQHRYFWDLKGHVPGTRLPLDGV